MIMSKCILKHKIFKDTFDFRPSIYLSTYPMTQLSCRWTPKGNCKDMDIFYTSSNIKKFLQFYKKFFQSFSPAKKITFNFRIEPGKTNIKNKLK